MALDFMTIWGSAKTTLLNTESFDLDNHLREPYISTTRARLVTNLKFVKLIYDNYEQMISDFENKNVQVEIVGLRLMLLKKALHGDSDIKGFKENLGIYFNHGEFQRKVLDRKMIAKFICLFILSMARSINNCNADLSSLNDEDRKYFDLEYIKSELMEVPNKFI